MTISEIETNIKFLQRILIILKEEPTSTEDIIFKKYVEFESLVKVKLFIQKKGIRTERGSIYQSNDLSDVIRSNPIDVNEDIIKLAQKRLRTNTNLINILYN